MWIRDHINAIIAGCHALIRIMSDPYSAMPPARSRNSCTTNRTEHSLRSGRKATAAADCCAQSAVYNFRLITTI
jgi:hypothetical protein